MLQFLFTVNKIWLPVRTGGYVLLGVLMEELLNVGGLSQPVDSC